MLTTIIPFVKKYWKILLLILEAIIGIALFILLQKRNSNEFADKLKLINDQHELEITKINLAREKERQELKNNEENLQKQLTEIKAHYSQQVSNLDQKTNKIIEDTSKKYVNDPKQLSVELSKKLGIELYVPGDKK